MLAEFFAWWGGQLTDLARHGLRPPGNTPCGARQPDAVLVVPVGDFPACATEIELVQRRHGVAAPIGRFALGGAALDGAAARRGPVVLSLAVIALALPVNHSSKAQAAMEIMVMPET